MSKKTPEGEVKARIREVLDSLDKCWFFAPAANEWTRIGVPDVVGCYRGRFFALEAKRDEKHKPTLSQRLIHARIRAAGGIILVVHAGNVESLHHKLSNQCP